MRAVLQRHQDAHMAGFDEEHAAIAFLPVPQYLVASRIDMRSRRDLDLLQ